MNIILVSVIGVWLIATPNRSYLRIIRDIPGQNMFEQKIPLEKNFVAICFPGIIAVILSLFLPLKWSIICAVLLTPVALVLSRLLPQKQLGKNQINLQELANACEILATGLEAGLPLRMMVKEISKLGIPHISEIFNAIFLRVELGSVEAEVWGSFREYPVFGELARDISLALESGLVIADSCRNYAQKFQENLQDKAIEAARKVGVKSVLPLMCCYLPAFMLIGILPIVGGNIPQLSI